MICFHRAASKRSCGEAAMLAPHFKAVASPVHVQAAVSLETEQL